MFQFVEKIEYLHIYIALVPVQSKEKIEHPKPYISQYPSTLLALNTLKPYSLEMSAIVEMNTAVAVDSRADVIAMLSALPHADQWFVVENALSVLKGAGPIKSKAKKVRVPGEPKKGYMHILHEIVTPLLKDAAANETDEAAKPLYTQVKPRSQVAKALWARVKSNELAVDAITTEDVLGAFAAWKASPPETTYQSKKKDSDSVSKPPKEPKAPKPPKAPKEPKIKVPKAKKLDGMTDEEKKAHFQARAAKAAASRAANKAAKAAEPAGTDAAAAQSDMIDLEMEDQFEEIATALDTTPADAAPGVEGVAVEEYKWEHDFGTGVKTYGRMDDTDGMSYIYDGTTGAYLGAYMEKTNKLNPKIPDPCVAE